MRANKLTFGIFGLALGLIVTWLWIATSPDTAHPIAATAQYEQFTQRNRCGDQRNTQHATLLLRGSTSVAIIDAAEWLEINDPALEAPLRLSINNQTDGTLKGEYRYPELFGTENHAEQWRPYCTDGTCGFSVIYYANEIAPDADYQRDISLNIETVDGVSHQAGYYRRALPPRTNTAMGAAFVPIDGIIQDNQLSVTATPSYYADMLIKLQITDADGAREVEYKFPEKAIGSITVSETLMPPVQYAAGFLLANDATRNRTVESKIELINTSDPFFACDATEG